MSAVSVVARALARAAPRAGLAARSNAAAAAAPRTACSARRWASTAAAADPTAAQPDIVVDGGAADAAAVAARTADVEIRFTASTYFDASAGSVPDEHKVGDFKVALMVTVADLELTAAQRARLLALCGPRYRAETDELKVTCEKFPSRIENKRWGMRMLQDVVDEARRAPEAGQ